MVLDVSKVDPTPSSNLWRAVQFVRVASGVCITVAIRDGHIRPSESEPVEARPRARQAVEAEHVHRDPLAARRGAPAQEEQAFIGGPGGAGASYVCFDYRLRPSRRANCSRGLHPRIESEPTL